MPLDILDGILSQFHPGRTLHGDIWVALEVKYWTLKRSGCSLVQENGYYWRKLWKVLSPTDLTISRSSLEQVLLCPSHKQNRMVDMLSTSRNDPIDKIGVGICMHDIQQSRWKAYLKKNGSSNYFVQWRRPICWNNITSIEGLLQEFTSSFLWVYGEIRSHQWIK